MVEDSTLILESGLMWLFVKGKLNRNDDCLKKQNLVLGERVLNCLGGKLSLGAFSFE